MDVRDYFRPGGGPGRLTPRRLGNLIQQLPPSSRYRTKLLEAHPDDRWGPTEYQLADLKDWIQHLSRVLWAVNLPAGKNPPDFQAAPRPTDKAEQRRKEEAAEADQERKAKILRAMRTGDWSEIGIDPATHKYTISE